MFLIYLVPRRLSPYPFAASTAALTAFLEQELQIKPLPIVGPPAHRHNRRANPDLLLALRPVESHADPQLATTTTASGGSGVERQKVIVAPILAHLLPPSLVQQQQQQQPMNPADETGGTKLQAGIGGAPNTANSAETPRWQPPVQRQMSAAGMQQRINILESMFRLVEANNVKLLDENRKLRERLRQHNLI